MDVSLYQKTGAGRDKNQNQGIVIVCCFASMMSAVSFGYSLLAGSQMAQGVSTSK